MSTFNEYGRKPTAFQASQNRKLADTRDALKRVPAHLMFGRGTGTRETRPRRAQHEKQGPVQTNVRRIC